MGRARPNGEDGADGPSLRRGGAGDRMGPRLGQPPRVEADLPDRQSKTAAARMTPTSPARSAALLWCAAAVMVCAAASAGDTDSAASAVAAPEVISDFLIQNVCLDMAGTALEAVSPIDGDPRCAAQRDLSPGEKLPYHKHDHPSPGDRAAVPRGYQRRDSYPVETASFGRVVEHSGDFGAGEGRRFGVFDAGRGDGGDITVTSANAASFAATEDGGGGFQLFVGASCNGRVSPAGLAASWLIALFDPSRATPLQGEAVARLDDLREGRQDNCPPRLNAAFTRLYVMPVLYRAAQGQGTPVALTTLISEHYGGERREDADHVERFYFTRELGATRWERWQNVQHSRGFSTEKLAKAAADFVSTSRCSTPEIPQGTAFVMIDCREWTLIVPPDNPAGDRPGFFLDAVRSRHLADELFPAPGPR